MRAYPRRLGPMLALVAFASLPGRAETVVPAERVKSAVIVRSEAARGSSRLGSLRPGQEASYEGTEGGWHVAR